MHKEKKFQTVPLAELASKAIAFHTDPVRPVILVVDDEVVIADTLTAILSKSGITVLTAYNGHSALDIARVIPPNLLLTDVVMPDMNGIDLAIAVTQAVPDCKILLFSGQAATVDLLAATEDNGRNFSIIAKPIHPTDLLTKVTESLNSQAIQHPSAGVDHFSGPTAYQSS